MGLPSFLFGIGAAILGVTLGISVYFTIRLVMPARMGYLTITKEYYEDLRADYEQKEIREDMSPEQKAKARHEINELLKASYIDELTIAQENNRHVLYKKS